MPTVSSITPTALLHSLTQPIANRNRRAILTTRRPMEPLLGWMKTPEYLWIPRILGVVYTVVPLFVEYVNMFVKR